MENKTDQVDKRAKAVGYVYNKVSEYTKELRKKNLTSREIGLAIKNKIPILVNEASKLTGVKESTISMIYHGEINKL